MKWTAGIPLGLALLAAGYGLGRMGAPGERRAERPRTLPTPVELPESTQESREFLATLQSALAEPMLLQRTLRSAQALSQLSTTNVEDAIALYHREEDAKEPIKDLLVSAWVHFDPQAAFDHVQSAGAFNQQQMLPGLLEGWATLDPQAARSAYATIPKKDRPKFGPASQISVAPLGGLIKGWARSGQPGVLEFLSEQDEGTKQARWLTFCLETRLRREGATALRDWVEDLSEDDFPSRFSRLILERSAKTLAEADPQLAATWATSHAESESATPILRGVAKAWAGRDGTAAMRWLAGFPASEAVSGAAGSAFPVWLAHDREAAVAWADAAAGVPVWDPAVAQYASSVAKDDPPAGLAIGEQIDNPKLRSKTITGIAKRWYAKAPGPATAWLEESDLDDEQREFVTRRAELASRSKRPQKVLPVDPRRRK